MRNLRAVDLNLLVTLDVLLEERSVRGAARRLHVTPPAMSHQLRRLRELLGDELLVRAGRGMVTTPRAEAMAAPVRALLRQAERVLAAGVDFAPARLRRAFRVVCTDHISTVLLPRVEQILWAEAPGVDLHVCPARPEMMEELRSGTVDLAIRVIGKVRPEMHTRVLFRDRYVTVARPAHPRVRGPGLTLDAFLAEAHVLVAPEGDPRGPIDELLAAQGKQRRVARTQPSFLAALWLVAESDALMTVSRRVVEATAARLPMRVLPTPLPVEDYDLSMVWHPRVDAAAADAWFRDVVVRAADGL
ncbi:MAG: LysR family transcriptional regulator [Myxococcota bacterium]